MESEKTSGGDKYSKLAGNTIIFAISSFSTSAQKAGLWFNCKKWQYSCTTT